ncbi:disulfide bond formation protein B [Candidatus Pacearchaeota archaeon CG10_big_fil_rev_8_21_14_0_10_34_76]|nr:MAG: disulfide bond formation protein B [Candidatus Pacearchaeota archaeon CG10_big_fil_rev_8_21_14_0_10_34_76]
MVFWDQSVIKIFAVLTLIAQVVIVAYLLDWVIFKASGKRFGDKLWKFFGKRGLLFMFIISLTAMVGSLIFSELLKFAPCTLCWYQRIFMYPMVFIAGMALIRKERRRIMPYLVMLSVIGLLIAGFHYYNQTSENPVDLPCSALGYSASCSESFFAEFGYITIPMMAFTAFLGIIVLWFMSRRN